MKRFILTSVALAMLAAAGTGLYAGDEHDHSGHDHAGHDHGQPAKPAQPPASPSTPSAPANPEAAPKLELSSTTIDFGEVWQGTPVSGEVTLKNTGKSTLKIIGVKASCGCTTPTKPKESLEPGESDKLTVSYDTNKRKGPANQTVTITTNDPTQPSVLVSVKGNVKAMYEMKPQDGIFFSNVFKDTQAQQSIRITNLYSDKMNLQVKEGQTFDPFEVTLKEVEPGMVYEVSAATKPPLKEGSAMIDVVLTTGVEKSPEMHVRVSAFVMPPVQVRPAKIMVPPTMPKAQEKPITISFPPDQPVKVLSAKADLETISVEIQPQLNPATAQKGAASSQITVKVTIPAGDLPPGGARVEITTDSTDPKFAKLTVPIEIVKTPAPQPRTPTKIQPAAPGNTTLKPTAAQPGTGSTAPTPGNTPTAPTPDKPATGDKPAEPTKP